jgi:hypothetical protein
MADTPAPYTQSIFPFIERGDVEGIAALPDADPMLVHARQEQRCEFN